MMTMPSFPCEGGCACGAVRYALTEDPLGLHVCHCTECQSLTGSAFVLSMPTLRRSLTLIRGEPDLVKFETRSGKSKLDRRCSDCGSRLWSESLSFPESVILRPSTLDDTSWLTPVAHIWTVSAQPWVVIPEGVLRYEENVADYAIVVRAWKERGDG